MMEHLGWDGVQRLRDKVRKPDEMRKRLAHTGLDLSKAPDWFFEDDQFQTIAAR